MQLLIVRHGEAQPYAGSDAERSLTPRGMEQAAAAGQCLAQLQVGFDAVWVSPYRRAQQTADILLPAAAVDTRHKQTVSGITPEDAPEQVLKLLQSAGVERLMMVSHQPLVSGLAGLLLSGHTHAGPTMGTASMVYLQCDMLQPGCGELLWLRHAPSYERVQ